MSIDEKTEPSEVVFLIGAGISIPIGIPAMQGMYSNFLKRAQSNITPQEESTLRFFTQKLGVAEDLEDFLLAANAIADFKPSSLSSFVERAVSDRQKTRNLCGYENRLKKRIGEVIAVRKRILDFMSNTCFQFDRAKASDIFGNFISAISKSGCPVYSTNYDFALEHVATDRDITIEDNFPKKGQQRIWNKDIHFPLGNALTLIKLHGSVTWYVDKDGEIERIDLDTHIDPVGKKVERLVIFPTRFKDIYDQHFFALYRHFLSALSSARVLVVIGHSLRDDYLRAAIIERYRKKELQIVIVDPVFPKVLLKELKPARLGTTGDINHVPLEFEEFSDELAFLILNSSPSDLASKCATIVHHMSSKSNKIRIRGNIGSLKPGDVKKFKAIIDAYLLPQQKPAYVRVWLDTKYTTAEGQKREMSSQFLDEGKVKICSGLTGMVHEEIPIQVKVPDYPEWIQYSSKVTLRVAIVQGEVKKLDQVKERDIFATVERELT